MLPSLATMILAAALGQAGPETAWLKAVPADADVVIRVRGIEAVRDDLIAMIRAMSPALGERAAPALEQAVAHVREQLGEPATRTPFLALMRVAPPERPGSPPFAVIVQSNNYQGVIDSLGGKGKTKQEPGGLDSFPGPQGQTLFAGKGDGFVVFGPDSKLVTGVVKPAGKTLGDSLPEELSRRLLDGDLGLYVNVAALQSRYGEQIDAARQQFMAVLDQAGQQAGNAAMMDAAKQIYGGLFDALKVADGLALNFDFDREALKLAGEVTVRSDSDIAKGLGEARGSDFAGLGKLPADGTYYIGMSVSPALFARLQSMGLNMMFGGTRPSPEIQRAMDLHKAAGRTETVGMSRVGDGVQGLNVMTTEDPRKLMEASLAMSRALKSAKPGPFAELIKDVSVTPDARKYKDTSFTEVVVKMDLDALAKLQPNPAAAESTRQMFGGDTLRTFLGVQDKSVLSVTAKDWDTARGLLDAYTQGQNPLGQSASFKAIRSQLPDQPSMVMLLSAQGLVRQMASQFAGMLQNPDLKPPADMPKETALIGGALKPGTKGYQFQLIIPSEVGPVFEKGLGPVIRGLQGQVNQ